ncbi:hypothetical protein DFR70_11220 [Nocardia tenerifensis]|uniref:Uncharacterized protein n=1 Tax=Nocardia tenerifensis TaxID=228006 RepID=A0A318JUI0_9NOCA|nr:hypothetical protein DFR70_11220 [Nocardia tenerifensis]
MPIAGEISARERGRATAIRKLDGTAVAGISAATGLFDRPARRPVAAAGEYLATPREPSDLPAR